MDAPPQPTASTTTLLDLNDDCLKEVFAHMDRNGLAVVADVCVRFRQNSMHSARSKYKKILYSYMSQRSTMYEYSILRNFGAFIERITVDGTRHHKRHAMVFQKRFIELLNRYCDGTSIDLTLYEMDLSDEIAILMVPLLARVHKLQLNCCRYGEKFLKNLSLWASELRELFFYGPEIEDLNQHFPKLVSIFFRHYSSEIAAFLKENPQLKQAEFVSVSNHSIFRSIAKYVPKIEKIEISLDRPTASNDAWSAEFFGRLRELKSLELVARGDTCFVPNVIHEIAAANIALEFLKLVGPDLKFHTTKFIDGISKLQHLKTLHLRYVWNLSATHLIEMVKPLNGLLEIVLESLGMSMSMDSDELLTLVQNAKKLQILDWSAEHCTRQVSIIDAGTFMKIKAITEQRGEKLTLHLPATVFTADIPAELISAARGLLSLKIR